MAKWPAAGSYPATMGRYPGTLNKYPGSGTSLFPSGSMTPAALISVMQALNTWQLLNVGDIGNLRTDNSGNARDWATPTPGTTDPVMTTDPILGRTVASSAAATRRLTNAWNPPSTATSPHYRIAVVRLDQHVGGKTAIAAGSTANRLCGLLSSLMLGRANQSGNTATGPNYDFPERKWFIVEEYYDGATTNSYTRIGPIQVSGVSVATFDSTSLGLFANTAGSNWGNSSIAFFAAANAQPADRAAVRAALVAYYGTGIWTTRSKLCRYEFRGDSQVRHDASFSNNGFRRRWFDDLDPLYPTMSIGNTADGSWGSPDCRHSGISGDSLVDQNTLVDTQLGSGGSMQGAGAMDLSIISCGTVDLAIDLVSGATALSRMSTLATNILTREPNAKMGIMSLVPYPGNPANFDDFNNGLPGLVTTLNGSFPGRVRYVPAREQLPGPYDDANYIVPGNQHMNETASRNLVGPIVPATLGDWVAAITA